jgi:hypothetical protein
MNWRSIAAITLGAALALPALAAEKTIKKSEVPKAVLEAAAARYPKAEMTGFSQEEEAGQTVFEVRLKEAGAWTDVVLSREGKILSEEKTISMKDLPEAVQQGLSASLHAKAKVLKVERVTEFDKPETTTFEILVQGGKQKWELVFSSDGKLAKMETKSGGAKD